MIGVRRLVRKAPRVAAGGDLAHDAAWRALNVSLVALQLLPLGPFIWPLAYREIRRAARHSGGAAATTTLRMAIWTLVASHIIVGAAAIVLVLVF